MATLKRKEEKDLQALITRSRNGDMGATMELLKQFSPLIYKICATLNIRYSKILPLDDLIDNARQLFLYLTMMEYDPNGKAHYAYFMKTHLHARLVQLYRPRIKYYVAFNPLNLYKDIYANTTNEIIENERQIIINNLQKFINTKFGKRQKDILYGHICENKSRDKIADRYHISHNRAKSIQKRCLEILRKYLKKFKIMGIKDV